jgi:hypothetical protein
MLELPDSFHWTYDSLGAFTAQKLPDKGLWLVPAPAFSKTGPKSSARSRYFKSYETLRQLVLRFCDVKDNASALAFVNEYGPLTFEGRRDGEECFKTWKFATHIDRLVRVAALKGESERGEGMMDEIGEDGWYCATLNLAIETHPVSKRPVLRVSPNALKDVIGMTVARMITDKQAMVRVCRYCGKLFEVGPGKRTRRAEFCADEHRDKYHNEFPSEGK